MPLRKLKSKEIRPPAEHFGAVSALDSQAAPRAGAGVD
jgi:hypothetical protein